MEEFKGNEGIFKQMKGLKVTYDKPEKIRLRHIVLASIYVLGSYKMPYSKNTITTEEELDMEVLHYNFLRKYNLL